MDKIRAKRLLRSCDDVTKTAGRAYREGKDIERNPAVLQIYIDSLTVAIGELAHIVKEIVYELEKEEK